MNIYIDEFKKNGKQYIVDEPLVIFVEQVADSWRTVSAPFGIIEYADTIEHLVHNIEVELGFLWDNYVGRPDEELTYGAQVLRDQLVERFG